MKRDSVIILRKDEQEEVWGQLTDICEAHPDIEYSKVRTSKFPFEHNGYKFKKLNYKTVYIN